MVCNNRRIRPLRPRLVKIDTKQFRLIFHKLLLKGLMEVELFTSIHHEDFLRIQFVRFEQFAIDELFDIALGRHLEMTDQLLPLETLDVQVDEIPMNIV